MLDRARGGDVGSSKEEEEEEEEPEAALDSGADSGSDSGLGLEGMVVCLTGTCKMKRSAMFELIEKAGGVVSKSVTKKVHV